MSYTADISELALTRFADVCGFLACQQLDLAAVLYSESGWYATAHNPNGDASGIFQAMPATLKGLGFAPELPPDARAARFRTLTAADQMPWLKRYYAPYRGKLNSVTACYLATFLPADLAHAGNDQYVLAQKGGYRGVIYTANAAFDANRDLCIRVGELGQAVRRNCIGPRWADLVSRLSGGAVSPQAKSGLRLGDSLGTGETYGARFCARGGGRCLRATHQGCGGGVPEKRTPGTRRYPRPAYHGQAQGGLAVARFGTSYGGGSGRHRVVRGLCWRDEDSALRGCSGYANAAATQIVIRADLSPERQRETVVHEIAHAAFEESACAVAVAEHPCRCCGKRPRPKRRWRWRKPLCDNGYLACLLR